MLSFAFQATSGTERSHPLGEIKHKALAYQKDTVVLDAFGERIHVEWNPDAAVTPQGQSNTTDKAGGLKL